MRRLAPSCALLALAAALGLACAGLAGGSRADTAVLPQGLGLPWTDPAHHSALEQLLVPIGATVAGRTFDIRCEGDNDWGTLAASRGFDPSTEAGYAANDGVRYSRVTNRYVSSSTLVELSPRVCLALQEFAQAAVKPTKCTPLVEQTVATTKQVTVTRYRTVTVKKPTRINGRLYRPGTYRIPYRAVETRPATTTTQLPGPPVPCWTGAEAARTDPGAVCWRLHDAQGRSGISCFRSAQDTAQAYWDRYDSYAGALATLAHEAVHEWQMQAGQPVPASAVVEAQAECVGMQWVQSVAVALGDTPDDGQAIADYLWRTQYPETRYYPGAYAATYPYWSADCVPGGALDARSDKAGAWP